jgi:hypothetical protein
MKLEQIVQELLNVTDEELMQVHVFVKEQLLLWKTQKRNKD